MITVGRFLDNDWWGACCSEVVEFLAPAPLEELKPSVAAAVIRHLGDPTITVAQVKRSQEMGDDEIRSAYAFIRQDPTIGAFVNSPYYHHRLRTAFAETTVREWIAEPDRPHRILAGETVVSKTVEIHPSKGTCGYRCAMCLWSDRDTLTYEGQRLTADGLLTTQQWLHLLDQLAKLKVSTIVISGGGEALMNRELPTILAYARTLGMKRHVYTTGFNLSKASDRLWSEMACCQQVRFSIHGADEEQYSKIVRIPVNLGAFARVTDCILRLISLRDELSSGSRVGAGFVVQPGNVDQIDPMAAYAADCGLDFLDIRKDEVDVTDALTESNIEDIVAQVKRIRTATVRGHYGGTRVGFSDELVALANGFNPIRTHADECRAKYFRPTISPYGVFAPCDLKAEPRFAQTGFSFGAVSSGLDNVLATLGERKIPDACRQCMPSSRTGNAIYAKLLSDWRDGFPLSDQPFATSNTECC